LLFKIVSFSPAFVIPLVSTRIMSAHDFANRRRSFTNGPAHHRYGLNEQAVGEELSIQHDIQQTLYSPIQERPQLPVTPQPDVAHLRNSYLSPHTSFHRRTSSTNTSPQFHQLVSAAPDPYGMTPNFGPASMDGFGGHLSLNTHDL
jgi:hypothetical protein